MDHRPEISPSLYRAGQGEPLVLLHGFMSTWHQWRPVMADLVPYFEVIAPTLAGHLGGPPYDEDENTLAAAGDVMERHLDELGVGRAHLVGNSMGGALVLELAKRGRALSVIAIAPGGGWAPDSGEADRLARLFARQRQLARVFGPIVPAVIKSPLLRRLAMHDVMRHGELVPAGRCGPDDARVPSVPDLPARDRRVAVGSGAGDRSRSDFSAYADRLAP